MGFLQFLFSKKFLKHFLIAIGVTVILILITLQSLSWYTKHNDYIIVPDFRGMQAQDIMNSPDYKNYQFSVIDSVFDMDKTKGSILTQDPFPGSKVKKNRTVYISITSIIPEKTTMPDLHDLTLRQAQSMLESAGLKMGKLLYIRSFDEDAVQNQLFHGKPIKTGTSLDKGSFIDLTVGMGAKAMERQIDSNERDAN
ncbi:MAG: PASTA domain-containing protein [Bacteroidales bacterium]|nr:PASTA domain-containing protein [Bacteroidales bacterium]MDD4602616.1 PASTA domain-containing protein [Bacteroidales bacterium]